MPSRLATVFVFDAARALLDVQQPGEPVGCGLVLQAPGHPGKPAFRATHSVGSKKGTEHAEDSAKSKEHQRTGAVKRGNLEEKQKQSARQKETTGNQQLPPLAGALQQRHRTGRGAHAQSMSMLAGEPRSPSESKSNDLQGGTVNLPESEE